MAAQDIIGKLSICQDENLLGLKLYDFTKAYAADNTGGYGAPNPATTDFATDVVLITLPGGTQVTINLFGTFPTATDTVAFAVANTALGLAADAELPDGLYTFERTQTGTFSAVAFTVSTTSYFIVSSAAECCITTLYKSIDICDLKCGSENKSLKKVTELRTLLDAAKTLACCGLPNKSVEVFEYVKKCCDC